MSFDVFEQYATDESKESNGTWFDLTDTARVLVARSGNKAYAKELSAQYERNQKLLSSKTEAADTKSEQIMIEVIAKTLLLGWEGLSFKGVDLPYSFENAKKLLALKDFRRQIVAFAEDVDAYKLKQELDQKEA